MLWIVILFGILKVNLTSVLGFYKTFIYMETTLKVWWQRLYVPGNNHIHDKTVTIGGKRWDTDFNTCLRH